MENFEDYILESEGRSIKDYIKKIRSNLFPVILITSASLIVTVIYAMTAINIYESKTILKISKPQNNILETSMLNDIQGFTDDRFISTEIGIMNSYSIRYNVAKALIDTFKSVNNKDDFYLVLDKSEFFKNKNRELLPAKALAEQLASDISIEQQKGIDLVDITAKSPSPFEAALIADCYANEYVKYNLNINRSLLTNVKDFLALQVKDKQKDLTLSEDSLSEYQSKKGIIALDVQSQALITQLANLEAQRDNVKIDMVTANNALIQLKDELKQQSPKIASYLESAASQTYFQAIQDEIAKLKVTKDLALLNKKNSRENSLLQDYDSNINVLRDKLNSQLDLVKNGIFSSSPDLVKDLLQKTIDANIQTHTLNIQLAELSSIINKYDVQFNKLPTTSIEYARLERRREADKKLSSLLEEKYQEAQINELSQPGNVIIIDKGIVPGLPSAPNRLRLIIIGFLLGAGISIGFVFIREYFSNTVKTPEDLENKKINVLAWIPNIEGIDKNGHRDFEFIVSKKPDSIPSEAFKALRQRIQYSKVDEGGLKTILITSAAPSEGKTVVSLNLAGSFAQLGHKTLLLDMDLRKPRIHTVFKQAKQPGIIDYLFKKASLNDIIHPTDMENMSYITSGTLPPNPSEMLASKNMKEFIKLLRNEYDIIIIDSAPMMTVIDTEILSTYVDATILVVSADSTDIEAMTKSTEMLKKGSKSFIGAVLNNFTYKSGYGSYYKYYYYYSHNGNGEKKFSANIKPTLKLF